MPLNSRIIGGVIGGVVALAIMVLLIFGWRSKGSAKEVAMEDEEKAAAAPTKEEVQQIREEYFANPKHELPYGLLGAAAFKYNGLSNAL